MKNKIHSFIVVALMVLFSANAVCADYLKRLSAITYGKDLFVAVGQEGKILASPDGVHWTKIAISKPNDRPFFNDIVWNGKMYVAVGLSGSIATSHDGLTWKAAKLNMSYKHALQKVTWDGNKFLTIGTGGNLFISQDGDTWVDHSNKFPYPKLSVAWNGAKYVAIGWGRPLISTDGIQWDITEPGNIGPLYNITWGNKLFVAVGSRGNIVTSTNGKDWIQRDSTIKDNLVGVDFACDIFFALGQMGTLLTSRDGLTWEKRKTGTLGEINSVSCNGENYIAVGGDIYDNVMDPGSSKYAAETLILRSNDTVNWERITP